MAKYFKYLVFVALFFFGPTLKIPQVMAVDFRSGDTVTVTKGQTIDGTLFATGQNINIDGSVNGDIICAGKDIAINGIVNGDILCAGQSLTINATVSGNIRTAGQEIYISSKVDRNISTIGQTINIKDAKINGDVIVLSQDTNFSGFIGKSLVGMGGNFNISGKIHDINVTVDQLSFTKTASVSGDIIYTSENIASISSGASLSGQIHRYVTTTNTKSTVQPKSIQKSINTFFGKYKISSLLIYLGLGIMFVLLFPVISRNFLIIITEHPRKSLGLGLMILFIIPTILFFLTITIIGIPIAIIFTLVVAFLLFLSRIYISLPIGKAFLKWAWEKKSDDIVWQMVIGVMLTWMMFGIPVFGWLITMISVFWGFGTICLSILNRKSEKI
jgi:hypothetical protein